MIQGQYLTITHNDKSISIITLKEFTEDRVNYSERFCGESMSTLSKDTCKMEYLTISSIHAIRVSNQSEIDLVSPHSELCDICNKYKSDVVNCDIKTGERTEIKSNVCKQCFNEGKVTMGGF